MTLRYFNLAKVLIAMHCGARNDVFVRKMKRRLLVLFANFFQLKIFFKYYNNVLKKILSLHRQDCFKSVTYLSYENMAKGLVLVSSESYLRS